MINLVTVGHHTEFPQCYCLYSLWYTLHPVTYFITESSYLLIFHLLPISPTTTAVSLSLSVLFAHLSFFFKIEFHRIETIRPLSFLSDLFYLA